MRAHDLVHAHSEREIVRWELEEGIPPDVDLVEEHAWQEGREPKGLLVGDEVHLVPTLGERDAELGRHRARSAIRRIARDPDDHARPPCWCSPRRAASTSLIQPSTMLSVCSSATPATRIT